MEQSIFSKIIAGDIPCHKVYEDDRTFVFLDIHPIQPGHTLVVPKTQVNEFQDLDEADYSALFATVQRVAQQLKEVFPDKRVGLKVIGVDVPHAHVHLFPFSTMEEYDFSPDISADPDHAMLATIAKKLNIKEN